MSGGEKALIALQIGAIAMGGFQAAQSAGSALAAAFAAAGTFQVMQSAVLEQRLAAQALDFKLIPSEPVQFAFRTQDFK